MHYLRGHCFYCFFIILLTACGGEYNGSAQNADSGINTLRTLSDSNTSIADTQPPSVVLTHPVNLEQDVPRDISLAFTYSEAIDVDSINLTASTLRELLPSDTSEDNGLETLAISGNWMYDAEHYVATFTPNSTLKANTVYQFTISDYADTTGNLAVESYQVTFQTITQITIQQQPSSVTANTGESVSFSVSAMGNGMLSYQWLRNGRRLPNQNDATLTIDAVIYTDAGEFSVEISDNNGSRVSDSATLQINQTLQFTLQPSPQSSDLNQPVKFAAHAVSSSPLTYQWFHDGAPDNRSQSDNEGGTTLNIAEAKLSDAGEYYVTATNLQGSTDSLRVNLEIAGEVNINTQPKDATVYEGLYLLEPFSFFVSASGTDNQYQWYKNDDPIPAATAERFFIENITQSSAGNYSVLVSNAFNNEYSSIATLTVLESTLITDQPSDIIVWESTTAQFEVLATGAPPLVYQWYKDAQILEGETHSELSIIDASAENLGLYHATIISGAFVADAPYSYSRQESEKASLGLYQVPTIVIQPSGDQVYGAESHTLSITATGSGKLLYQWQKDNIDIENNNRYKGANTDTLVIVNMQQNNAGSYRVVITSDLDVNRLYPTISETAELTYLMPPTFTRQPQDITTTEGETIQLAVEAEGSSTLLYQWYRGGNEIPGATSPTLAFANINKADSGVYYVTISYSDGKSTQSFAAEITVNRRLIIAQSPTNTSHFPGNDVTLNVVISGENRPFSYQWIKDGQDIGAAISTDSLTNAHIITDINVNHVGLYQVVVRDSAGNEEISLSAQLSLKVPATIATYQTRDQTAWEGELMLFQVTATGSLPILYQWYKNGILIPGANKNQLNLPAISLSDAGNYTVLASNGGGSELSPPVTLIVNRLPFITSQPLGAAVNIGDDHTFTVSAGGDHISYQWLKNGSRIEGATSDTLSIINISMSDNGDYTARIQNGGGEIHSETAILNVRGPVTIISSPKSISVEQGHAAVLSVAVTGTAPIRYQWYKNDQLMAGENAATLTFDSATISDAAEYHVVVNNDAEIEAISTKATLEVTINYAIFLNVIGSGVVRSSPLGLNCQASLSCTASYPQSTLITLEAVPAQGYQLLGWNGLDCASATCTIELKEDLRVSATFSEIVVDRDYGKWQAEDFNYLYDIGPDQEYATPSDVPWESMEGGSLVRIHWRPEPYTDKWAINTEASADRPVVVLGMPNEAGDLPVISGAGARTRSELSFWNPQRVLIKIGGSNLPSGQTPAHIYIERLNIRDANRDSTFINSSGSLQSYSINAAGILIEDGNQIFIRGNEIHENGNGVFTASRAKNITISHNYIYDNGVEYQNNYHNVYSESTNIVYEYNRFGALRNEATGNNIEDRSAGLIIRYNWIEGGNYQLNIADTDKDFILSEPDYRSTFVYGNILIESDINLGNREFIQYGGDSGRANFFRKGRLFLYNNTFVNYNTARAYLLKMPTAEETADVRNNAVYALNGKNSETDSHDISTGITSSDGTINVRSNWLQEGWDLPSLATNVTNLGNTEGYKPGFEDFGKQKFRPATVSALLNGAGEQHSNANTIHYQYKKHQEQRIRLSGGTRHLGALTNFSEDSGESNFELAIEHYSPLGDAFQLDIIANNASGIAWNYDLEQYIVVQEGRGLLHRYDRQFKHLGVITIVGNIDDDIEGITYIGGNLFLLVTERNYAHKIYINNDTIEIRGDLDTSQAYRLPPPPTDFGLEAIAYIPPSEGQLGRVYLAQGGSSADSQATMKVYTFDLTPDNLPKALKDYADDSLIVEEPFGNNIEATFGGFIGDISGMTYDARTENLIFVSQESSSAIQVDPATGDVISQLNLTGAPAFEGVVSGFNHHLVFVSEPYWAKEYSLEKVIINSHPTGATIATGSNLMLSVDATGSGSLSYQWIKNGENIDGATGNTLSLSNVGIDDSGSYDVRITSSNNTSARSNTAIIVVYEPIVIVSQPVDAMTLDAGESFSLTVSVTGSGPIAYQWYKNGSALPGEITATFNISSLAVTDAGVYRCQISNIGSSINTDTTLTISGAIEIIEHPANATITDGSSVTFEVLATGAETLSYQWRKESLNIGGANSANYRIQSVSINDNGLYDVIINNSFSSETSNSATLVVIPVGGESGSIDLFWTPPSNRTNGEPFASNEITSFRIFYGTDESSISSQIFISDAAQRTLRIDNLPDGTYHFRIMLTDIFGLESALSPIHTVTLGN